MGWLADRRQARLEAETEQRLRRLIFNASRTSPDFYLHREFVPILGSLRVNTVLAEFGLPAVVEEREQAA